MKDLRELIQELEYSIEPGTKVVIEFYRGTQHEDADGTSYDDNDWSIYTIKGSGLDYKREYVSTGDYLEQAIDNALKKLEKKESIYL